MGQNTRGILGHILVQGTSAKIESLTQTRRTVAMGALSYFRSRTAPNILTAPLTNIVWCFVVYVLAETVASSGRSRGRPPLWRPEQATVPSTALAMSYRVVRYDYRLIVVPMHRAGCIQAVDADDSSPHHTCARSAWCGATSDTGSEWRCNTFTTTARLSQERLHQLCFYAKVKCGRVVWQNFTHAGLWRVCSCVTPSLLYTALCYVDAICHLVAICLSPIILVWIAMQAMCCNVGLCIRLHNVICSAADMLALCMIMCVQLAQHLLGTCARCMRYEQLRGPVAEAGVDTSTELYRTAIMVTAVLLLLPVFVVLRAVAAGWIVCTALLWYVRVMLCVVCVIRDVEVYDGSVAATRAQSACTHVRTAEPGHEHTPGDEQSPQKSATGSSRGGGAHSAQATRVEGYVLDEPEQHNSCMRRSDVCDVDVCDWSVAAARAQPARTHVGMNTPAHKHSTRDDDQQCQNSSTGCLRGGGAHSQDIVNVEDNAPESAELHADGEPSVFAVYELEHARAVRFNVPMWGPFAGGHGEEIYYAAQTCGDGACAVHALFGKPALNGELRLPNARAAVHSLLDESANDVRVQTQRFPQLYENVRLALWAELAEVQAYAELRLPYEKGPTPESQTFWHHLEETTKEMIKSFVTQKAHDISQYRSAKQNLQAKALQLFTPMYEEAVVRPLAVMLGYLTDIECDVLHASEHIVAASYACLPSTARDASFLAPLVAEPSKCRYNALFDADPCYDVIREQFFHNPWRRAPEVRDATCAMSCHLEEHGDADGQQLLCEIALVVQQRAELNEVFQRPAQFTDQIAWTCFRQCTLHGDEALFQYWYSVDELALFACRACANVTIGVYDHAQACFVESARVNGYPGGTAHVGLDAGDRCRGHFSRLWSETTVQSLCSDETEGSEAGGASEESDDEDEPPGAGCDDGESDRGSAAKPNEHGGSEAKDGVSVAGGQDDGKEAADGVDAAAVALECLASLAQQEIAQDKKAAESSSDSSDDGPENAAGELDEWSDSGRSDASDCFHAAVEPDASWTTLEDLELEKARRVALLLRDKPLLPPMPPAMHDTIPPGASWLDVRSGVKLPAAHCAFVGADGRQCDWVGQCSDDIVEHVVNVHRQEVLRIADEVDETALVNGRPWNKNFHGADKTMLKSVVYSLQNPCFRRLIMSYYEEAIATKERQGVPTIGPSIDRRTAGHLREVYQSAKVRSLICFVCAQIHPETPLPGSSIQMRQVFIDPAGELNAKQFLDEHTEQPMPNYVYVSAQAFLANLCRRTYRERFVEKIVGLREDPYLGFVESPEAWEWRRWYKTARGQFWDLLCCPEDVVRTSACNHDGHVECAADKIICSDCRVPVCQNCFSFLSARKPGDIPLPFSTKLGMGFTY